MSARLYINTVRYLRPEQLFWRVWRAIPLPLSPPAGAIPPVRQGVREWTKPPERSSCMVDRATIRFLNVDGDLSAGEEVWRDSGKSFLWLYNLHYFYDLVAKNHEFRREWHHELISRWVLQNPVGVGIGWQPYPLSLRIVNWIKWALAGNRLSASASQSLPEQARVLTRRVEFEQLGNHLIANAKALLFAGQYFMGDEADRWHTQSVRILHRELQEQVLRDGGHIERSPMYHALMLEDLLDMFNVMRAYQRLEAEKELVGRLVRSAGLMRRWLQVLTHPDGEIALFNDAAFDIALPPALLETYAVDLGLGTAPLITSDMTELRESGYVRMQQGPAVVLADVAPLGPDYLPGHGHADTLTFELSLFGMRTVVDTGVSTYENGKDRMFERGTTAHNTVQVDDENSSEVWASFRVARRARPFGLHVDHGREALTVTCAHDGYRRLPGRVVHHRRWTLRVDSLEVEDRLEGRYQKAEARLLLHPQVAPVNPTGAAAVSGCLALPGGQKVLWETKGARGQYVPARYHPEFGRSDPTCCLCIIPDVPAFSLRLSWGPDSQVAPTCTS